MLFRHQASCANWTPTSLTSRQVQYQVHVQPQHQWLQHGLLQFYSARPPRVPHEARMQQGQPSTSSTRSQLRPDPTADDLDLLAAQSLSFTPYSSNVDASIPYAAAPTPSGHTAAPTAAKPTTGRQQTLPTIKESATAGIGSGPGQSRITAADKLQLTEAEAKDIARRLRKPRRPQPGLPILRIFRYGIDDLRLYKAIDAAGLEGRVVVVDSAEFADAVVTTLKKRTGRNVNQAVAKRIAAGPGVPLVVLRAVSPEKLLESLGPLLDTSVPSSAVQQSQSPHMQLAQQRRHHQPQEASDSNTPSAAKPALGKEPRLFRLEESEDDGSGELLTLLWGSSVAASGSQDTRHPHSTASSTLLKSTSSPPHSGVEPSARWQAWQASQSAAAEESLFGYVRDIDIEDSRDYMLHPNPKARAGERYKLLKPLRHSSRIRRKRLNKHLAERRADW